MGLLPGPHNLHHSSSSRASVSSQSSTRANPRSVSSNNSNPPHSRSHSSQSQPHTGPYQSTDFPPLPGGSPNGQSIAPEQPLMTLVSQGSAWNSNTRSTTITSGTGPPTFDQNGLHVSSAAGAAYLNAQFVQPTPGRFASPDGRFNRPPSKGSGELYNPKQGGGRASTPVGPSSPANAELKEEVAANALSATLGKLEVVDGEAAIRL